MSGLKERFPRTACKEWTAKNEQQRADSKERAAKNELQRTNAKSETVADAAGRAASRPQCAPRELAALESAATAAACHHYRAG